MRYKGRPYRVTSHMFMGCTTDNVNGENFDRYKYEITLNRSTRHTQRLWQGIERGLTMYAIWEHTKNPIKKWFIGWFMGFKTYK